MKIQNEQVGLRIDLLLSQQSSYSRTQIQKLIKSGDVLVDDKPCKPNTRLEKDQTIFIPEPHTRVTSIHPANIPSLSIVYEDEELLVINKPAGLLVHRQSGSKNDPTVVDALLVHHPKIVSVGENSTRPGIMHRLDKDVSGLMVIAKTQKMYESLKAQFQNRTVYKEYLALVYGTLPKEHDLIDLKIARSKTRGRMVARPGSQEGKEAKTEYEVISRFKNRTFVRVILHTGRTHQIRVHMRAINHPIVGDPLYKNLHMKHIRLVNIGRIFLHAHKLRIQMISGKEKTFEAPLPIELQTILTSLK